MRSKEQRKIQKNPKEEKILRRKEMANGKKGVNESQKCKLEKC